MEEIQTKIRQLREKGWTLAAIARELGMTWDGVRFWETGQRSPSNPKLALAALDALLQRRRIPKKKVKKSEDMGTHSGDNLL